ncbi:hypothetical protein MQC88_08235 [Luteimonas sp. 50]|uniref:Uncharacterized protein n=1 Tax=Cognatiluteimonas sedimenti TaxID=2927791 RepID=A0ABT0A4P3_9GAMM|nr:hypothetical protein [Lysobacter sedimenti]MCJ0825942.1 hypothetical protein [Lysobacter sedimenti]
MTPKKLDKIRRHLTSMAASPHGLKSDELIAFAKKLGRTKSSRGKEPTWVREDIPELSPPLSIPNHSKALKSGTARSIIDALLSDVDEWELHLAEVEGPDHDQEDDEDLSA